MSAAPPIYWIAGIVLVAFVALVLGSGLLGAVRAHRSGESILNGAARGLLRGLVSFLLLIAAAFAVLTVLAFAWVAFAYLYFAVLESS